MFPRSLLSLLLVSVAVHATTLTVGTLTDFEGSPVYQYGVQAAFRFVSESPSLFENHTLELVEFAEGCDPRRAIQQMFLMLTQHNPLYILGATCSGSSIRTAALAELKQVPMLSVNSGAVELSDKLLYPYFSRAISSLVSSEDVLFSFMQHSGWSRIAILALDTDFGRSGVTAALSLAPKYNITVTTQMYIPPGITSASDSKLTDQMQLLQLPNTWVIHVIGYGDECLFILQYLRDHAFFRTGFVVFIDDSCASTIEEADPETQRLFEGLLYVTGRSGDVADATQETAFLNAVREVAGSALESMSDDDILRSEAVGHWNVAMTLFTALDGFVRAGGNVSDGAARLAFLRNHTYNGLYQNVSFDANGDPKEFAYNVINLVYTTQRLSPIEVGWANWRNTEWLWTLDFVNPVDASLFARRAALSVNDTFTCGPIVWPGGSSSRPLGDDVYERVLPSTVISAVFLGLGVCLSVVLVGCGVVLAKQYNHPALRASSSLFRVVMLVGVACGIIAQIAVAQAPSDTMCALTLWGAQLSYVLVLGPLFLVSYRINRIFSMGNTFKRANIPDAYIAVRLSLLLVFVLSVLLWNQLDNPPHTFLSIERTRDVYYESQLCAYSSPSQSSAALISLLVVDGLLFLTGCVLAYIAYRLTMIDKYRIYLDVKENSVLLVIFIGVSACGGIVLAAFPNRLHLSMTVQALSLFFLNTACLVVCIGHKLLNVYRMSEVAAQAQSSVRTVADGARSHARPANLSLSSEESPPARERDVLGSPTKHIRPSPVHTVQVFLNSPRSQQEDTNSK